MKTVMGRIIWLELFQTSGKIINQQPADYIGDMDGQTKNQSEQRLDPMNKLIDRNFSDNVKVPIDVNQ